MTGPRTRRGALLLALVLAAGLALRALDLADPWSERGFKSAFGGWAIGAQARGFVEHGFLEARFVPYEARVELADGTVERRWYVHHPAAVAVVTAAAMRLLGDAEWVPRLPWLLASLLLLVAAFRLLAEAWGPRVALAGTAVLAVVPLAAHYGTMLWCDQAVLALYALLLRRYLLWMRGGGSRHLAAAGAYALAGGLLDWTMHVALVGYGAHALGLALARRRRGVPLRALAPLLLPAAGGALAIALHYAHVRLVLSPEEIAADAERTIGWVTGFGDLRTFVANHARHLVELVTLPLLAVLVVGLAWQARAAARGELDAEDALLVALFLPGPLYVLLFPARSTNHGFFWGLGLLWVAATGGLVLARALRAWWRARPALGPLAAAALALAALGPAAARDVRLWREQRGTRVARLAEEPWLAPVLADPDAVVLLTPGAAQVLAYYARAPVLGPVVTVAALETLRERVLARLGPDRRVLFLFTADAFPFAQPLHEHLSAVAPSERHRLEVPGEPPLVVEAFDLGAWARG